MRYMSFVFRIRALPSVCIEQPIDLGIAWIILHDSLDPFTNRSIRYKSFLALEVSLDGQRCLVGNFSSLLFGDSL